MVCRRRVDDLFETSDADIEAIRHEIGEDDDKLRIVEELLEQWFKCQKHLPHNYDKAMARNFIRGSKFNLEIVKRKLEGYFLAKHAYPVFYQQRNPAGKEIERAFDIVNIVRLPKLTKKGERICFVSLADGDPDNYSMDAAAKLFWMLYDFTLTCEKPVTSEILIFDCHRLTPNHLTQLLSPAFKNCISVLRDAYASRVSQLHVINCPSMMEKLIVAIKPILHEKVRERFFVVKGVESLLEHLQPDVLPSDVGGSLGSLRAYMKKWQEVLMENADWFEKQEDVKIVGTPPKRIGKFSSSIELEGTFRQLNID